MGKECLSGELASAVAGITVSPQLRGPRLWGLTTKSEEHRKRAEHVISFRAPHLFFIREVSYEKSTRGWGSV